MTDLFLPNHFTPKLSDLDLKMVKSIPPGGNWKNIPISVPSKRLEQIRESYRAGKGSRSTYYGRLKPENPSYTISTYFNRPGNGCFIHYDFEGEQHRMISQREAARLQSFPDNFIFYGSRTSINNQIGNAVPPILAHQIAQCFPEEGSFVDLFSGAGGLALGFHWAGWKQLVANDIEKYFLQTNQSNLGGDAVLGDIRQDEILNEIVSKAKQGLKKNDGGPFIVLGGPPCQGFSTAGNARSMNDMRNHLFKQYVLVLERLSPDAFVFENVPGIQNMDNGKVFQSIKERLSQAGYDIETLIVRSEEFGIPQRRKRVLIVGIKGGAFNIKRLEPITHFQREGELFLQSTRSIFGAKEAIDDLPPLLPGQDGSNLQYLNTPSNSYQELMRGVMNVNEFTRMIREG